MAGGLMFSQQRKNLTRTIPELQSVSDTLRHGKLYSTCGYVQRLAETHPTVKTCQYIIGEPSKKDIRKYGSERFMCGDPVITRRDGTKSPYCQAHHERCYVPLTKPDGGPASEDE